MLFLDTAEGVATALRPYWSEAVGGRANVVQSQEDMLEIVPPGTSKGSGVRTLLDHLNVPVQEVHTNKFCSLTSDFFLLIFRLCSLIKKDAKEF